MAVQDEIPKSRITLTYRTEIEGEPEDISLPLRLLMMGDFSLGTSKDRKVDLDERRLRSIDGTNLNSLMKDMDMSLKVTVPNKVDPDKGDDLDVDLPIENMKSFTPAQIIENVPKLKGLMLMKKLLLEADSNIQNKKALRGMVEDLYSSQEAFDKVLGELKGFDGFRLPEKKKEE